MIWDRRKEVFRSIMVGAWVVILLVNGLHGSWGRDEVDREFSDGRARDMATAFYIGLLFDIARGNLHGLY